MLFNNSVFILFVWLLDRNRSHLLHSYCRELILYHLRLVALTRSPLLSNTNLSVMNVHQRRYCCFCIHNSNHACHLLLCRQIWDKSPGFSHVNIPEFVIKSVLCIPLAVFTTVNFITPFTTPYDPMQVVKATETHTWSRLYTLTIVP